MRHVEPIIGVPQLGDARTAGRSDRSLECVSRAIGSRTRVDWREYNGVAIREQLNGIAGSYKSKDGPISSCRPILSLAVDAIHTINDRRSRPGNEMASRTLTSDSTGLLHRAST